MSPPPACSCTPGSNEQDHGACCDREAGAACSLSKSKRARRTQLLREHSHLGHGHGMVTESSTLEQCLDGKGFGNGSMAAATSATTSATRDCLSANVPTNRGADAASQGGGGTSFRTSEEVLQVSVLALSTESPYCDLVWFQRLCAPSGRETEAGWEEGVNFPAIRARLVVAGLVVAGRGKGMPIRRQHHPIHAHERAILQRWHQACARARYAIVYIDSTRSSLFAMPLDILFPMPLDTLGRSHVPTTRDLKSLQPQMLQDHQRMEEEAEEQVEEEEEEWASERAAVRGRIPLVILHWSMPLCTVPRSPPHSLEHRYNTDAKFV